MLKSHHSSKCITSVRLLYLPLASSFSFSFSLSSCILERILQEFSFCTREHELIFVCAFRVFTRISTARPSYSSLPENVCANAFYASANPSSTWIKVSKWHLWWKLARKWRRKKILHWIHQQRAKTHTHIRWEMVTSFFRRCFSCSYVLFNDRNKTCQRCALHFRWLFRLMFAYVLPLPFYCLQGAFDIARFICETVFFTSNAESIALPSPVFSSLKWFIVAHVTVQINKSYVRPGFSSNTPNGWWHRNGLPFILVSCAYSEDYVYWIISMFITNKELHYCLNIHIE